MGWLMMLFQASPNNRHSLTLTGTPEVVWVTTSHLKTDFQSSAWMPTVIYTTK